ncbi:phosphoglycerate dehydrogenase-like enzyme [Actinoplanes lutulentus]|uniref:Lactate dehydrogenase-like 2-hydroxyacid dehydrogenase n=1 Tax=Actinoplanes lutulentus TaxID=1287878 RepID=A0A327ZCK1_9ACTN|nr:D-2-hydroxyacid dehydrogenase family protein [Actinoplanes lutulentus]MBB2947411.1 phosphoglycerate dehydrogenase-like enzyme [Actinoplanes lutulentus]RAK36685.1 lactate dehydrogenase-like 2-hydroxyacid dehydrogenase [Actinoplanes lutulentus]
MKIVVLDDYQRVARAYGPFETLADAEVEVLHEHLADHHDLVNALTGAQVVVAMRERTPFTAELLRDLPDLRLLITTGMVNASIDLAAAKEQGVTVCGTTAAGSAVSSNTAELTWALILAVQRNVVTEDRALRAGRWQTTVGTDLNGSTLGVLGLGRLGSQIARIGRAFDMRVIAWSQNLTAERAAEVGATLVSRDQLFAESDVLSVHLKLSDRTIGLVGAAELKAMKPSAVLINTSRGPIVDRTALAVALTTGSIAGAGLDVFDTEPLPAGDPLRAAPNTVLLPHLGYVTDRTYQGWFQQIVENIAAWQAGTPLRTIG